MVSSLQKRKCLTIYLVKTMEELHELMTNADTTNCYDDEECQKKTVERFYYLSLPFVCMYDLPTEMGLEEGKYKFADKDTLLFKSTKTVEQLSRIIGRDGESYVLIEARNIATSKLGLIKF